MYICLKSDRCQQFIFYFYYVKYVVSKDFTFFQHIDMNIPMYLKNNHEANIIQNEISLNDETENDCTKIVSELGWPRRSGSPSEVRRFCTDGSNFSL